MPLGKIKWYNYAYQFELYFIIKKINKKTEVMFLILPINLKEMLFKKFIW